MNELAATANRTTRINSLEIADRTDKLHKDVMRDIRNLIDQGAITERNFALSEYRDASGKSNPMYLLDFEAIMTLVTGYDAPRRNAVIKRWLALERGEAAPLAEMAGRAPADLHETLLDVPVINNLISCMSETMTTMNRVLGRLEKLEAAPAAAPRRQLPLPGLGKLQLNSVAEIKAFVTAACQLIPDGAVDKSLFYQRYRNWCWHTNKHPFDYSNFCKGLYQAGLPIRATQRKTGKTTPPLKLILGLRLLTPGLEAQA